MFKKGDFVCLTGDDKTYKVLVTKQHAGLRTFSGVITYSEFENIKALEVGEYAHDFLNDRFELEKQNAI